MAKQEDVTDLQGILDELRTSGEQRDEVSLDNIHEAIGDRSYGPFLLVPALIEISPIGGIPGVPTVLAILVIIFAAQMVFGRKTFWIPHFLGRRSVDGGKLVKAASYLEGIARWADKIFHGRFEWLTRKPFDRLAAALCILLAMTVPPLEVVPFASTAPMGAIALFGLALLVKDGLLVLTGTAASLASLYIVYSSLLQ